MENLSPAEFGVNAESTGTTEGTDIRCDLVTVLTSAEEPKKRLTKTIYRDESGQIAVRDYDWGKFYSAKHDVASGLRDLMARIIPRLNEHQHLLYGCMTPTAEAAPDFLRRTHAKQKNGDEPSFQDTSHEWVPLDIDSIPVPTNEDGSPWFNPVSNPAAAATYLRDMVLPTEFHGKAVGWQLTSGAGIKDGIRMRLHFWLAERRTAAEIREWLSPYMKRRNLTDPARVIDGAIYFASQPMYASKPVIEPGATEPVTGPRSGYLSGLLGEYVVPPELTIPEREIIKEKAAKRTTSYEAIGGPKKVVYEDDDPAITGWAHALVDKFRADGTAPGTQLNNRAHELGRLLKDGPSWGRAASEALAEECAERFSTAPRVLETVMNGYIRSTNPPGSGPIKMRDMMAGTEAFIRDNPERFSTNEQQDGTEPTDIFGDGSMTSEPVLTRDMLPKVIADFAWDMAALMGVEPAMLAMPALMVAATAIDDAIQLQPKLFNTKWTEAARLWIANVAPSGGRKSPAARAAQAPLAAIQKEWKHEDKQRAELHKAVMLQWKGQQQNSMQVGAPDIGRGPPTEPPKRQLIVDSFTMEKLFPILAENSRGIGILADELSGFIGGLDVYHSGGKGSDRSDALQLWSGGARSRDLIKVSYYVPNWSASVFGNIPTNELRKMSACGKLSDDGLLQRFVLFQGRTLGVGVDRVPDKAAHDAYDAMVRALLQFVLPVGPITLSPAARPYWDEVEKLAYALEQLPSSPDALKSHYAKIPSTFTRLLLTLHCIESATAPATESGVRFIDREVSADTARRAADLMVDFFIPQAVKVYGVLFGDSLEPLRKIALGILAEGENKTKITERDIYRWVRELGGPEHAATRAQVIGELVDYGWLFPPDDAGPMATGWIINPLVFERFAEYQKEERQRRERVRAKIAESIETVRSTYSKRRKT